jgi:hypothetical protein
LDERSPAFRTRRRVKPFQRITATGAFASTEPPRTPVFADLGDPTQGETEQRNRCQSRCVLRVPAKERTPILNIGDRQPRRPRRINRTMLEEIADDQSASLSDLVR